jgi:hypothetical protein
MSSDPTNIIPFGKQVCAHFAAGLSGTTESGQFDAKPADVPQELAAMYLCIQALTEFLYENRNSIDHFVAGVVKKGGDDDMASLHLFTSEIRAADFALLLKAMDVSLMDNIRGTF